MGDFQKVLVVDDGARDTTRGLSVQLAELGFASVTTSVEATDDVLEMLPPPSAILVQMPRQSQSANYKQFMDLVARLKAKKDMNGIPVIVVEPRGAAGGGYASLLQSELGASVLSKPEL